MRASLRATYGVDLSRIREMRLVEVVDLVMWLPPACPLWLAMGGPASLTNNDRLLQVVAYLLQVIIYKLGGNKGKKPEPPGEPEYDHEQRAREIARSRKMQRWLDRQK